MQRTLAFCAHDVVLAGLHLVKRYAQRKQITAHVGLRQTILFRRGIAHRHNAPGIGIRICVVQPRSVKINQHKSTVFAPQYVLWLDVAVNDGRLRAVQQTQSLCDIKGDLPQRFVVQRSLLLCISFQRLSADILLVHLQRTVNLFHQQDGGEIRRAESCQFFINLPAARVHALDQMSNIAMIVQRKTDLTVFLLPDQRFQKLVLQRHGCTNPLPLDM